MLRPIRNGGGIALLVALFSVGLLTWTTFSAEESEASEPRKLSKKDRIDLAIAHEVEATKDPELGYVPRLRLLEAYDVAEAIRDEQASRRGIRNVNWEERGPDNVGGRTRAILIDANDPTGQTVWAGGVAGGIWKTSSITANPPGWSPINDFFENLAVTAIVQDPSNPQVMYFGTGEGWFNGDAVRGLGLWKSENGGDTWDALLSTRSGAFSYTQAMAVLSNGDVLVGTRGAGLQRSQDGGQTWTRILAAGVNGGTSNNVSDIEIASNGDLYVAFGVGSSGRIYKSTDQGGTWAPLHSNPGFATGSYQRVEVAVAPSNPNRVYALLEDGNGGDCLGIYRSDNGGGSWTAVSNPGALGMNNFARGQAWYDLIAAVDPVNPDRLFIGGVDVLLSEDAGASFRQIAQWFGGGGFQYVHADQHAMVFDPNDPNVMYFGNDGGVYRTENANASTPTIVDRNKGYNVTQYYACAVGPEVDFEEFLAGAQDNGTQRYTSLGVNATDEVTGGDGTFCHIDQDDREIQITSLQFNRYFLTSNGWASVQSFNFGDNARFINPHDYDDDANIIYACAANNQLVRVSNIGTGFPSDETLSLPAMGGRVSCVSVSPHTDNRVFLGLANGRVIRVDNAHDAAVATHINFASPMPGAYISCVAVGPNSDDHLMVTYSSFGVNSVWETRDGGDSWTSVEGNLPDMPVRWALYSPFNDQQVMIATELGVWSTDSIGATNVEWEPSNNGLANVRTDMLQIREEDGMVIAGTHGRGLFSTDAFSQSSLSFDQSEITVVEAGDEIEDQGCQGYTTVTVTLALDRPAREDALVLVEIDPTSTASLEDFELEGGLLFSVKQDSIQSFPITFRVIDDGIAEGEEFITLTLNPLNTTSVAVEATEQFTLYINDPHIDPDDAGSVGTVALIEEDFEGAALPEGWSVGSEGSTTTNLYRFGDPVELSGPTFQIPAHDGNIAVSNDQTCVCPKPDDRLILPELDFSSSVLGILEYDVYFRGFNGEIAEVWVSTDQGQSWETNAIPTAEEWTSRRLFLADYAGEPSVLIAFVYNDNGGWNYGLALDNVKVLSNFVQKIEVATDLTEDQHELGPNDKVDFYNPDGEVIGSLRNLGSHDFGCVNLSIDRAGLGATPFQNERNRAGDLLNKTFRVEVENPSAARDLELTLYFTAAEDSAWQDATGRAWEDIRLVTHPGAIADITPENPEPLGAGTVVQISDLQNFQVPESDHLALRASVFGQSAGYGAGIPQAETVVVRAQEITLTATPVDFTVVLDATIDEEISVVGYVMEEADAEGNWTELSTFTPDNGVYQVIDNQPVWGLNQYRLRVQYEDGTEDLAGPVEVYFYGNLADWVVFPNPFIDELSISFPEAPTDPVGMTLMDAAGRRVWTRGISQGTAGRLQSIPVTELNLATGIYLLKLELPDGTEQVVKLLKRNN